MATIQQGDAQNKLGNPQGKPTYSKFPIKPHHYTTERFGIIDVCGVNNGIEADETSWRPAHELTTYTLSAPLMTPVYKEKDYIVVARQAILPKNWNKIHVQPNMGDDIDATIVGTSIKATTWSTMLYNLAITLPGLIEVDIETAQTEDSLDALCATMTEFWQYVVINEYIFSYGSLLTKMGCSMAALYRNSNAECFDIAMDKAIEAINAEITAFEIKIDNEKTVVNIGIDKEYTKANTIGIREFLDIIRENPGKFEVTNVSISSQGTWIVNESEDVSTAGNGIVAALETLEFRFSEVAALTYNKPVDLARCWAYQLAVAEYFTNSHVDYVYSAELYRQYVWYLVKLNQIDEKLFTWNGISYEYDYLSSKYFEEIITAFNASLAEETISGLNYYAEYLASIFSYHRSLKYLDYFTGSKTRPLAVGDVTINPGAGGSINVIDVTRKGQAYKFLNAVNRIGRKAEDYAMEIMGVKQQHDWHNPLWLASVRSAVNAEITDNTGEAQITAPNSQTARLYGVDGKYKFDYKLDRDAIILGLTWYDVERSYCKGVHRSFMHVDRYDMYNPYLQYTGDQEIYKEEYDAAQTGTFGYVPAYEEFKQEPNRATGGFVTSLPGYTFLDGVDSNDRQGYDSLKNTHIGPEFIRSKPVEFDRFYNSLTGYSLGTYFHFIVDYYNDMEEKRKMAFNPGVAL